jgi:hypothetical protein
MKPDKMKETFYTGKAGLRSEEIEVDAASLSFG